MRLKQLFLLTTLLLLTLMSALLLHASLQELNAYRSARSGLQVMQLARLAMTVAEKTSFERDPANGLMSSNATSLAGTLEQMSKARQATDIAFTETFAALKHQADEQAANTLSLIHISEPTRPY